MYILYIRSFVLISYDIVDIFVNDYSSFLAHCWFQRRSVELKHVIRLKNNKKVIPDKVVLTYDKLKRSFTYC